MFNRQSYLDKLIQAKDSDFVKVLTGVRRCGKSTLLMLYKDWLLERGVEEDQVIEISYEKMENEPLKDGHRLHAVFCKTFLHNIAKKKYTPLRLKFFSDYFGLDRAFLSRKLSPVKLKMCA